MSKFVRCDGCGAEGEGHFGPSFSWHHVESSEDTDHGDFCSWACLSRWATARAIEREGIAVLNTPTEPPARVPVDWLETLQNQRATGDPENFEWFTDAENAPAALNTRDLNKDSDPS